MFQSGLYRVLPLGLWYNIGQVNDYGVEAGFLEAIEIARKAVEAGKDLLRVTGHKSTGEPWIPVGVGIHTGTAWVGSIAGTSEAADFTALGDNVNIAARLASNAGQGEVLISEATWSSAQVENKQLEIRDLELKGKSNLVRVRVLDAS